MVNDLNKVNKPYDPYEFREQQGYNSKRNSIAATVKKFFVNAKYDKNDSKIHFYNVKGEEKCSINVKEFPSDGVKGITYNYVNKILVITYESGRVIEVNLNGFINNVIGKIEKQIDVLSESIEEIINNETRLQTIVFSASEYVWDEEHNKMKINFYNANNELRDSVELFDTNKDGEIMVEAGNF